MIKFGAGSVFLTVALLAGLAVLACTSTPPTPTPDIPATVEAAVQQAHTYAYANSYPGCTGYGCRLRCRPLWLPCPRTLRFPTHGYTYTH